MDNKKHNEFRRDLASLLNKYSCENESNTVDYQLADYLIACLTAGNNLINDRERWYGYTNSPGQKRPTKLRNK